MTENKRFTVGWICAIETELIAAQLVLDEEYDYNDYEAVPNDNNTYSFGRIGRHNVVIATLPAGEYGTNSAASVARDMIRSFTDVRVALMVGIGGGAPLMEAGQSLKKDIRLGDVVVSKPGNGRSGVCQYDFGKDIQDRGFLQTEHLNQPPASLLTAVAALGAEFKRKGHSIEEDIAAILAGERPEVQREYQRPAADTDQLYASSYVHPKDAQSCTNCCDKAQLIPRPARGSGFDVTIHYGMIASGNSLMKNATRRNDFAIDQGILCFEMEAAGLMNQFPFLVVRGICDYSDTHKHNLWQGYAAMAAAMYAKKLLGRLSPARVEGETKLSDTLLRIRGDVQHVRSRVDQIDYRAALHHADALQDKFRTWLKLSDPSTNLMRALKLRHQDSGRWILQNSTFDAWLKEDGSFLWLHGLSGCGKTIITSTIIEHLRETASLRGDESVVYFFFDTQDGAKQNLDQALRSMIAQACAVRQNDSSRHFLEQMYDSCQNGLSQPSTAKLRECFSSICRDRQLTIVLDALDECSVRRDLEELLVWIREIKGAGHSRIIVTSRPEQVIKEKFPPEQVPAMEIRGNAQDDDIKRFINATVSDPQGGFARWKDRKDLQDKIKSSLVSKADGMFRWVACQIEDLKTCLKPSTLNLALAFLPKDLNQTYDRILEEIPHAYLADAIRVLQFLVYSKRPLNLKELAEACATQPHRNPGFCQEDLIPNISEVAGYCGSLTRTVINLDRPLDQISLDHTGHFTYLELAHASVKEYLMSDRLKPRIRDRLTESQARLCIIEVSLAHLEHYYRESRFERPGESVDELEERRARLPSSFCGFAAEHWMYQLNHVGVENQDLWSWIIGITTAPDFNWFVTGIHNPDKQSFGVLRTASSDVPSMCFLAALLGLTEYVRALVRIGRIDLGEAGCLASPLAAAAHSGRASTVEIFLEHNPAFHTKVHIGHAVTAATQMGHFEIVQMLLDHDAKFFADARKFLPAIESVSETGSSRIARLLLDHCGHLAGQADCIELYGRALQRACVEGHFDIAQMLIQRNADVNALGGVHGTALQEASRRGHSDTVRMLIGKQANVNAQGHPIYGNALQAASSQGHTEIVKFLIEHGADVNAQGGSYGSALQAASVVGDLDLVRILIEHGAEVNAEGGKFGSALRAASIYGHTAIVEFLLANQANVRAQGEHPTSALEEALRYSHLTVAEMLVQHGADLAEVKATRIFSTPGVQPVRIVSEKKMEQMRKWLREHGADVDLIKSLYGFA